MNQTTQRPPACMGGWCRVREKCVHYVAVSKPNERLCLPGQMNRFKPIVEKAKTPCEQ